MTVQLTPTGLSTSSQTEIVAAKGARLQAQFGPNFDLSPTESLTGQLVAILSEEDALTEEAVLAVYRSMDPRNAIGRPLDARIGFTGTTRKGATHSEVEGLLTFSLADSYAAGSLVRNDDTNEVWTLTATVVAGAPGAFAATLQAVDTGPRIANAGSTWTLITVNPNVTGFTNPTDDADPGRLVEEDGDAKERRLVELYSQNVGATAAISSAVSRFVNEQTGVGTILGIRTYHNPLVSPADADGIPFKAFNVVVELAPSVPDAATQQAIWDAIFKAMGAGGEAYGTDYVGTSTDSEGKAQPVKFDVVTNVDIVIEIDLVTTTTESAVSSNIEAVVAAEVIRQAQINYEKSGRDVTDLDVRGIVFEMQKAGTISGVDGVVVRLSISPAPPAVVSKIPVGIREKADFDSGNITVIQV